MMIMFNSKKYFVFAALTAADGGGAGGGGATVVIVCYQMFCVDWHCYYSYFEIVAMTNENKNEIIATKIMANCQLV